MRDAPAGTEIPETFEPSDYHEKGLTRARKQLAALVALNPQQIAKKAEIAHKKEMTSYRARLKKDQDLHARYDDMLKQARAWTPPSPEHYGLKEFMVKQIIESMEWDCNLNAPPPVAKTPEAWYASELESAQWNVNYHEEQHKNEVERCVKSTKWVKQLRASIYSPHNPTEHAQ